MSRLCGRNQENDKPVAGRPFVHPIKPQTKAAGNGETRDLVLLEFVADQGINVAALEHRDAQLPSDLDGSL